MADLPQRAGMPWDAVLGVLPHLLWTLLLLFIVLWIGKDGLNALAGRVQKVGVAGVEVEFRHDLEKAAEKADTPISGVDLGRASRRLAREQALVQGARILWVDDVPGNNEVEMKLLEDAGARVDVQTSNEAARGAVERVRYDLVISDLGRADPRDNPVQFADWFATTRAASPLIFYTGSPVRPTPASAFGVTDRPDELVHLVLDALARVRD